MSEIVMVEFPVGKALTGECVDAVRELTASLVAQQPKFYGATIMVDHTSGHVVNLMRWETADDFIRFRDSNQDTIAPSIGRFNPSPRIFEVQAEINASG